MKLYEKYKTLFNKYNVNTPLRIAHFMAQIEAESGLVSKSENLNYSAEGLSKTFPKYFPTISKANEYARKPILIGSRVYANRMGNGNEKSMDGWKYRGRGFLQITGKDNYQLLSKETGINCLNNPDILLEEPNAIISALWYWNKAKLNTFADADLLDAISDTINIGHRTAKVGDANGYQNRKVCLNKWKLILK